MGEKATKYDCRKDKLSEVRKCEGGSSLYQFMKLYCNDGVGWRKWPRKRWGRRRKRRRRRRRRRHIGWSAFCESSELRFNCRSDCMNSPSWIHYSSIIYEISLQILTRGEEEGGGGGGGATPWDHLAYCILHIQMEKTRPIRQWCVLSVCVMHFASCNGGGGSRGGGSGGGSSDGGGGSGGPLHPGTCFAGSREESKKFFSPMASKLQETVVRTYEHMFWPILPFKNPKYAVG